MWLFCLFVVIVNFLILSLVRLLVLYLVVVLCLLLELIVSDSLWWWFSWLLLCLFMVGLFSCYLTACCIYLFELFVWLLFCNSVAVI